MDVRKQGYLYALIAAIGWGTNFIACKLALEVLPPVTLLFFRFSIGVLILYGIYRNRPRPKIRKEDRKYIIGIGAFGYFLTIAVQQIATDMIDASVSSLIHTMTPVGIVFFAVFLLKERTNRRQNIGIGLSLAGAIIIIGGAGGNNSLAEIQIRGIQMENFSWLAVIGILWLGSICTAGANLWWNQALERVPASACSLFYPVMPFTTAALGIVLLGEKITMNFLIGAGLIVVGMIYTILGEMNDAKKGTET